MLKYFISSLFLPSIILFALTQTSNAYAQSNIMLTATDVVEHEDLMHVLRFQEINVAKLQFTGTDLLGKNFKIVIRDYVNGKLTKTDKIFDSHEDEHFKIKEKEFSFGVLVQRTISNKVKFSFNFLGFRAIREYTVAPEHKDFALKFFQHTKTEVSVPLNSAKTLMTFMLPYKSKNGVSIFSDILQTNIKPDSLGLQHPIPRYFLVDITFE